MNKFIAITGASKGIGHAAADALVNGGWSVISIALSSPEHFLVEFIHGGLGDPGKTKVLAKKLITHDQVLGIVNNLGLAKHETIGIVDPRHFAAVMDLNLRPTLQLTQPLLPGMQTARFGSNHQPHQTRDPRLRVSYKLCRGTGCTWVRHAYHGHRTRAGWHYRKCGSTWPQRNVTISPQQPSGSEGEARYWLRVPMERSARPLEIAAAIGFLANEKAAFHNRSDDFCRRRRKP